MARLKVLVCGGRNFADEQLLFKTLDSLNPLDVIIIDGCAKGADSLAYKWAIERGAMSERYPANWDKYGKRAGYLRNQQMLDEGKPDLVIAFPGGAGTAMMVRIAKQAGVQIWQV